MSADFWAGYFSGAIGIAVGNPLDIAKVRLQVGPRTFESQLIPRITESPGALLRGRCCVSALPGIHILMGFFRRRRAYPRIWSPERPSLHDL